MGFAKYGPFYVSLFCHLFVQSAFASSSTKSGKDKGGIGVISNAQQQQQHRHSFTNKRQQHLFLFILLLTFCMGVIGFNWLVFVHTMAHSFQEPLATLALFGSVGTKQSTLYTHTHTHTYSDLTVFSRCGVLCVKCSCLAAKLFCIHSRILKAEVVDEEMVGKGPENL